MLEKLLGLFSFGLVMLWCAGLLGWLMNIVKLFQLAGSPLDIEFMLRAVGILLAPLGAVLGYL